MILFTADWCTQCKPIKQFLDNNTRDVEVVNVDTESGEELMQKYNVRGLPTLISNGENIVGAAKIMQEIK
tara:strand:+ start:12467 stop:12676 length:210 start_codon:yes stop_codon:yes gene_type:complete